MKLDIFIPTYKRSLSLERVARDIERSRTACEAGDAIRPIFIVEADDEGTISQLRKDLSKNYIINTHKSSYAGAINCAYELTHADMFFCASDDLHFHRGWWTIMKKAIESNPDKMVFGTNDLFNKEVKQGLHATHYLVKRRYVETFGGSCDGLDCVLHEGYNHNYCDTEFIETAKSRGLFMPVLDSVVEHLHHYAKKSEYDETYKRNDSTFGNDKLLFASRKRLWTK